MALLEKTHLSKMRDRVNAGLRKSFTQDNELSEAISYALMGAGKRVRPVIVLLVAEALGHGLSALEAALATEFFHTASLIADDLPCMDDEEFRRERPTVHKIYGEATALLASYALISEGFRNIYENGEEMRRSGGQFSHLALQATSLALECAGRCTGIQGATLGQFLDLNEKKEGQKEIERIIALKTITLFEGAFVLGWVFGGGDFSQLDTVKKLAYHFGMAFQIRDDILDREEDAKKGKKSNISLILGKEGAQERFDLELNSFRYLLQELEIDTPPFEEICKRLST